MSGEGRPMANWNSEGLTAEVRRALDEEASEHGSPQRGFHQRRARLVDIHVPRAVAKVTLGEPSGSVKVRGPGHTKPAFRCAAPVQRDRRFRQLWPQQQNGDDQPANDHLVQFAMEDPARQCLDVFRGRAPGRATHQDVNLLQNNGDTDARQHGVYHDRSNAQCSASHLDHSEQDLQRTRANRDHAGQRRWWET
jgi:hypothetical protein